MGVSTFSLRPRCAANKSPTFTMRLGEQQGEFLRRDQGSCAPGRQPSEWTSSITRRQGNERLSAAGQDTALSGVRLRATSRGYREAAPKALLRDRTLWPEA